MVVQTTGEEQLYLSAGRILTFHYVLEVDEQTEIKSKRDFILIMISFSWVYFDDKETKSLVKKAIFQNIVPNCVSMNDDLLKELDNKRLVEDTEFFECYPDEDMILFIFKYFKEKKNLKNSRDDFLVFMKKNW